MPRRASPRTPQALINKSEGAFFEALFIARCGVHGIWARKNGLSAIYKAGGKACVVKSDVDFACFRKDGSVVMVDCKSFEGAHFTRSMLNDAQLVRCANYKRYGITSGLVVHLRELQQVVFYGVQDIYDKPPRKRFEAHDGLALGPRNYFDPSLIFRE